MAHFPKLEDSSRTYDKHELFTQWVLKKGVRVNGVLPAQTVGRGLGIIAQRKIEVGNSISA